MRRFADKLAVIKISLNPPSPPLITESECPTPVAAGDIIPGFGDFLLPVINGNNLLQVPKSDTDEIERQCSPPPRRCSQTSTFSDNSSVSISLNASYQNLLSPGVQNSNRGRSASHRYSEGSDTPPNEFLFVVQRPLSAQVKLIGINS